MEVKSIGLLLAGAAIHRAFEWIGWQTYDTPADGPRTRFLAHPMPIALGAALLTFGKSPNWEKVGVGAMTSAMSSWVGLKIN